MSNRTQHVRSHLLASIVLLAISIAPACGGDDESLAYDDLADAYCGLFVDCGQFADVASCREGLLGYDDYFVEQGVDIDAGVIAYDAEAARRCIDEIAASSCRVDGIFDAPSCAEAMVGSVPDGDSCSESEQCAGLGAVCDTGNCPDRCCSGTCVTTPLAEIGDSCRETSCVPDAYCLFAGNTLTCAARVPVGGSCSDSDACVAGAACDAGTETCFALAGPGESCVARTAGVSCLRGDNYCDPGEGVCKPDRKVGQSCSAQLDNCVGYAFCDAGTCAALPGLGDSCGAEPGCQGELFCVDGVCSTDGARGSYCPLGG